MRTLKPELVVSEHWRPPKDAAERERKLGHLAFEAIWIGMRYDGLTEETGFALLRRAPARLLMAQVFIDEERGQELLAWGTEGGDV